MPRKIIKLGKQYLVKGMLRCAKEIRREKVLEEAETSRTLVNQIGKCQTIFLGHMMRREKMVHVAPTGLMNGKCSRGRPTERMLEGMA